MKKEPDQNAVPQLKNELSNDLSMKRENKFLTPNLGINLQITIKICYLLEHNWWILKHNWKKIMEICNSISE